jgi:flagellar assembly protein FliH
MSKMWERADFWPTERIVRGEQDDFAQGLAEGRRTVEAELAGEREALFQLAGSLETLQPPSSALIASLIVMTVERLVIDIAGNVPIDGALLRERADSLAALIREEGNFVVAVHPDDMPILDSALPVVSDPALDRGTVQARTASEMREDGVMPALSRLRAEIARLGLR